MKPQILTYAAPGPLTRVRSLSVIASGPIIKSMELERENEDLEAALAELEKHQRRSERLPRTLKPCKWGRCPRHYRALRPKIWLSGQRRGQACLLCPLWWDKSARGQRGCWFNRAVSADAVLSSFSQTFRSSYFSLQMRLARGGEVPRRNMTSF